MALNLLTGYSRRLRSFVSMIEDLTLRNTKERLAKYLLDHAQVHEDMHRCPIPGSKKDLASLLGTIPETLSRVLRELKDQGIIQEKDRAFLLPSLEKLREIY